MSPCHEERGPPVFLVATMLSVLVGQNLDSAQEPGAHHTLRFRAGSSSQTLNVMAFSPDGQALAASLSGGKTVFVRTGDGEIVGSHADSPFILAYTKDGSRLLLASSKGFTSLDANTHAAVPLPPSDPSQEDGYTGLATEERNGKLIIVGLSPDSPAAKLGSVQVGDELVGVGDGPGGPITSVIGSSVAEVRKLLIGPVGTFVRLKIIPKGKPNAEVHAIRRQPIRKTATGFEFLPIATSHDNENVLHHMDELKRFVFRNARTGQTVATIVPASVEGIGQFAISADASRFAMVARQREHRNAGGVEIFRIAARERELYVPYAGSWRKVCFTHDGSKLLIGTENSIEILDLAKRKFAEPWRLAPEEKKEKVIASPGLAPIQAARELIDYHAEPPWGLKQLAASPKGVVAIGESSGAVRLGDLNRRKILHVIEPAEGEKQAAEGMAFSDDGKWLAYYVAGTLHLVDVSHVSPDPDPKP
jgi:WD40 repeat protein